MFTSCEYPAMIIGKSMRGRSVVENTGLEQSTTA